MFADVELLNNSEIRKVFKDFRTITNNSKTLIKKRQDIVNLLNYSKNVAILKTRVFNQDMNHSTVEDIVERMDTNSLNLAHNSIRESLSPGQNKRLDEKRETLTGIMRRLDFVDNFLNDNI